MAIQGVKEALEEVAVMIHGHRSEWSKQLRSMVSKPRLVAYSSVLPLLLVAHLGHAQVTTTITPTTGAGHIGTSVTQNGNVYNITGGTRPVNGTNLFHSFGEFSVGALDTARFLNTTPELATSNILGRVTGGNPSSLFGAIDTLSYGNANLFLLNPAGIVFGPNATLNVGGAVTFTTANYLRLADTGVFHAETTASSVLTSAPVAAFGFLGSNPETITVQGSHLSVPTGQSASFIAGGIAIGPSEVAGNPSQPARITAPEGQINLVSIASAGEVLTSTYQPTPVVAGGSINFGPGTLIDVSGNAGGSVRIRGGNLVIDNATVSADTVNAHAAPIAIDINLTGDLTISDTRAVPAMTATTSGTGNAGEVQIVATNMVASSTDPGFVAFALIDAHSSGEGSAANVNITTGSLTVTGPAGTWHFIESGPQATGPGGSVTITSQGLIQLTGTTISTGTQYAERIGVEPSGPAGNLSLTADRLITDNALFLTTASFEGETQQAGTVTLNARDISMTNTTVSAAGFFGGGAITIHADSLITEATQLDTFTALGPAEGITFNGRILELRNGSTWSTSTFGDSNAGEIRVEASDRVALLGHDGIDPSGLFSNSFGDLGSLGGSGNITVTTPKLTMREGRVNSSTATSGRGGDVTINAATIEASGEFPFPDSGGFFGITDIHPSGIFTQTVGSEFCAGPCGDAGNIVANVGTLSMGRGAQLNSGTTNTGRGGDITINATDSILMSGTLSTGQPGGIQSRTIGTAPDSGAGGNIALTAGQSVTISDGASVSASSTGPGNAGNIAINAGQQFEMRNSSVKTEAAQASGGNIDIQAIDRIRLVNSFISTSVLGGAGSGGNITIDPNVVILQNSQIFARAVQGAGGNITITTPLYLPDSTSIVSASSQFGLNGTVNIQSPTSNLAGTISSLPSSLRQVQSLQTGRCAALADSRSSSLIVAGRDILPAEPGGWSPSPFALMGEETDSLAIASPPVGAMIASADAPVSLRRLTPAGFLTQRFAENGLTGCRA